MINDPKHPLFGASLKIDRASSQLKALDLSIKQFFETKRYPFEAQADPKTEILWRLVRMHRTPDPMWSAMTEEIIHNLRCALDYLVFQLVILKTGAEPTTNKTQFPISRARVVLIVGEYHRCFVASGPMLLHSSNRCNRSRQGRMLEVPFGILANSRIGTSIARST